MFESQDENAEIKVIDFGLSKKFGDHKLDVIYGGVGSLSTMAPQVINNKYTSQADLWAVGVITFMLLSTLRPFYDKHPKLFIQKILEAKYNFTSQRWDRISKEAKDFISKLLVISEEKRMTAQKALKHRWLSKQFKLQDRQADDRSTAELAKDSLMHYKNTCLLKKIALNVIAHKSSTREILNLRKIFDQYDTANDGVISFQEFKNALRSSNYPKDLIAEIFHSIVSVLIWQMSGYFISFADSECFGNFQYFMTGREYEWEIELYRIYCRNARNTWAFGGRTDS